MKYTSIHKILILLILVFTCMHSHAQNPGNILKGIGNRIPQGGSGGGRPGGGSDSVIARNRFEDSVTVTVFFLDSSRGTRLDTSIDDFTKRFPIPATHVYLGNNGTATRSILFAPQLRAGWDPGFHAFDVYKRDVEEIKYYTTTRPYTELAYVLGSRSEQDIEILHTQNPKPYLNFSFNYRLINSPGFFRNQRTNHNNYVFTTWYQSKSKRYNLYQAFLSNQLQSGESGGMKTDKDYFNDPDYAKDRFLIPTKIGGDPKYTTDFFSNTMYTGNRYKEFNFIIRQQYDLGRKDSIVTDSIVIPLFFPRLRFEHTFNFGRYTYGFQDYEIDDPGKQVNTPDPVFYHDAYGITVPTDNRIYFSDKWKEISNDFSIYQFPDAKNLNQFIKLGAELQFLKGQFFYLSAPKGSASLYNLMTHGEYRNRTKNQKWDMLAFGKLWLNGYNLGDYHAYVSLQRLLGHKFGSFQVGFENANRSPSFIYDQRSGFYLDAPKNFNNENTTHLFASLFLQKAGIHLTGDYYLVGN
ncbi:MAG: putative porin, partial [Flavisolibacter sp.]